MYTLFDDKFLMLSTQLSVISHEPPTQPHFQALYMIYWAQLARKPILIIIDAKMERLLAFSNLLLEWVCRQIWFFISQSGAVQLPDFTLDFIYLPGANILPDFVPETRRL